MTSSAHRTRPSASSPRSSVPRISTVAANRTAIAELGERIARRDRRAAAATAAAQQEPGEHRDVVVGGDRGPQFGQAERPPTNDWRRGTRCATTVAKLPTIIPAGMARMAGIGLFDARSRLGPRALHRRAAASELSAGPARQKTGTQRVRVDLEAAVEARVVVHELKPGARRRALLLEGEGQPQAAAGRQGDLREVQRHLDLAPAVVRPGRPRVREVGRGCR